MLVLLCGLPGAGKTRLAEGLAAALGATVVSRDALRARRDPDWSDPAAQDAAFATLCDIVDARLANGATVVAEGMPFSRRAERERLRAIAARHAVACALLWLDLPLAVAQTRVAHDPMHAARNRDADGVAVVAARFEWPAPAEAAIRLDAHLDAEAVLASALRVLRR